MNYPAYTVILEGFVNIISPWDPFLNYSLIITVRLQAFYKPLDESKAIPAAELKAIFVNWKELIHCNRKLVK